MLGALFFAFLAAAGNAIYALGQREAISVKNGFNFIVLTAALTMFIGLAIAPLFGEPRYLLTIQLTWPWILISGVSNFLTYLGFNLLYTHYGTAQYILFVVQAVIITSFFVGVLYFKEIFNLYHYLALASAIITVIFFSLGQKENNRQSK